MFYKWLVNGGGMRMLRLLLTILFLVAVFSAVYLVLSSGPFPM